MKLKMVVNLFAGPCTGKSVLAADIFSALKKLHYNVEIISEYAKDLTWEERTNVLEGDQLSIFAKQHRRLVRIKDKIDIAVCESPLVMSLMYYNEELNLIDKEFYESLVFNAVSKYSNFNYFLLRDISIPYQEIGRNQTKEEAIAIDKGILEILVTNNVPYRNVNLTSAVSTIVNEVEQCLAC